MTHDGVESPAGAELPLCVDLDGTLVQTDLFAEAIFLFVKKFPWRLFHLLIWLLRGRAYAKQKVAAAVDIDPTTLPYHTEFLEFLKEERLRGRILVLATAADSKHAKAVEDHLHLFHEIVSSDGRTNNKGAAKARALTERFGVGQFAYAGNSAADKPIWKVAGERLVVNASPELTSEIDASGVERIFAGPPVRPFVFARAIRMHQWVKNLLLVVPALMAHVPISVPVLVSLVVAFFSFCFCASAVYLLNDLVDLPADRTHRYKRLRPLARGEMSLLVALGSIPLLLVSAVLLAAILPQEFLWVLGGYFGTTLAYSLRLKQIVLVDIITLASLYTVRLLAGAVAVGVVVSEWLLGFSMFFFFSLACVKRFSELRVARKSNESGARGRGYLASDLEQIAMFGTVSGYLSVLVLALYVSSVDVQRLYDSPGYLWLICPLVLYWLSRVWLLAHRGEFHDDPIVFAIRDKVSYLVGGACAGVMVWAAI
jgi:4-hydroxybenzoate polyprenyltransferase/phosphoserine phosphatase